MPARNIPILPSAPMIGALLASTGFAGKTPATLRGFYLNRDYNPAAAGGIYDVAGNLPERVADGVETGPLESGSWRRGWFQNRRKPGILRVMNARQGRLRAGFGCVSDAELR